MAQHCLIVTYYFPPLGGGGVQRLAKLMKYLALEGWRFTVLTAREENSSLPSDRTLLADIPDSSEIVRIPGISITGKSSPGTGGASYWKRWASAFLYIPDIRKSWLPKARAEILERVKNGEFDCVLISLPPYSLGMLASDLTKELKIPVVLDMRDPWTINPYKIHPTFWHRRKDWSIEKAAILNIRYGVSAYGSLPEFYRKHVPGFDPERWRVIPNGYDEDDFRKLSPVEHDASLFHIGFSGTFYSHINHPAPLFKAIAGLGELKKKVRFHHIGTSMIDLSQTARRYGVEANLQRWGYRRHAECLNLLAGMDALCFILDSRNINSKYTIGGKVYEYLRLKKPVLALVPEGGEAAGLIEAHDAGCVIPTTDTNAISETLCVWMLKKPDFSFRDITSLSRVHLAGLYHRFLSEMIRRPETK